MCPTANLLSLDKGLALAGLTLASLLSVLSFAVLASQPGESRATAESAPSSCGVLSTRRASPNSVTVYSSIPTRDRPAVGNSVISGTSGMESAADTASCMSVSARTAATTVHPRDSEAAESDSSKDVVEKLIEGEAEKKNSALLASLQDVRLCEHFLTEPFVQVVSIYCSRLVRVGVPSSFMEIRPRSIGITVYKKFHVLWAADIVGDQPVYGARLRNPEGEWLADLVQAGSPPQLIQKVLLHCGASVKSKISSTEFFGTKFFRQLGTKRHIHPQPEAPECFKCSARGERSWRWDMVTLARICDNQSCRAQKRKRAEEKIEVRHHVVERIFKTTHTHCINHRITRNSTRT